MTAASGANIESCSGASVDTVVTGSPETSDVRGPGVAGVDEELEEQVKRHFAEVHQSMVRTLEEVWRLGKALRAAKEQVRHGQWIPWLERIGIPVRMAQRAMALYDGYPEMRQLSYFDSVQAAMRALPAGRVANRDKCDNIATGETISVEPMTETAAAQPTQESASETGRAGADAREPPSAEATTETTSAAQPTQESASETGRAGADAREPPSAEVTTETTGAAQPVDESSCETGRSSADAVEPRSAEATAEATGATQPVDESSCEAGHASATAGETSRAEATTETTGAASAAHKSVDEQERARVDANEASCVIAGTTDGTVPAADRAGDDRTIQTAGEDLATVVKRLELFLEGTPARAASQREADLRALSKLIRVLAGAILRHLDRPAVKEELGDLTDEFVRGLHEVIERVNKRRAPGLRCVQCADGSAPDRRSRDWGARGSNGRQRCRRFQA